MRPLQGHCVNESGTVAGECEGSTKGNCSGHVTGMLKLDKRQVVHM